MSGTLLEQARSLHEDMELLERAMYSELGDPANANLKRVDAIARDQVHRPASADATIFPARALGRATRVSRNIVRGDHACADGTH